MDDWIDIRQKARELHAIAIAHPKGNHTAKGLIDACLAIDDLELVRYAPGSIVSESVLGFFERNAKLIRVARNQTDEDEAVVIAHEIGHFKLHHDPINEVTVASHLLGGDTIESGAGKVEGYSSRERKEVQADVFAGEFLCPSDWLRGEYIERGRRHKEIAKELGIPENLVMNQLIRALLLPPLRVVEEDNSQFQIKLDESQEIASKWLGAPLLVDAGPGTGKTRTLVHRIQHLLANEVEPSSILALTFSNKAAEEMRARISVMNKQAAIEMWIGTFHAFGMEVLTKWPGRVNRTEKVRVLDETGSLGLLEENLARLGLQYFQNIYDPAFELVHVLRAISRCKDELISPENYYIAAESYSEVAKTEEEKEKAQKTLEVARIYEQYVQLLKEKDSVDFGDLVMLAVQLLSEHEDIRKKLVGQYKHIVVDEYQDVNRASARLLKLLTNPDTGLWVVADPRQSIYRFRGAEPANVAEFAGQFGGERHSLARNYRSHEPVVKAFSEFSASMGRGKSMAGTWHAHRGHGGGVSLTATSTLVSEAEVIRDHIEKFRKAGIPYREQVVLARSHLTLARITGVLEKLGVPLLYLGDLFERSEIRDLLSLIALDAEFGNCGLTRLARLDEYSVPRTDSIAVIHWAKDNDRSIVEALANLSDIEGISPEATAGLGRLAKQLDGVDFGTSPWTLLTTWLFERSNYLKPLLASNDIHSQQKRIAIYHLLKVCAEHVGMKDPSRRRFLQRVRRIEALNHDSIYRAVASEAADMDAVRVMTIHGSKGLEFRGVHIPALATRYMPSSNRGARVPVPESLSQLAVEPEDHAAEEECLFFVAISRARDFISLTRADYYTAQRSTPSKFLNLLPGVVTEKRVNGFGSNYELPIVRRPQSVKATYSEDELSAYLDCPAKYYYRELEELRGGGSGSAYPGFHRCVFNTVKWMEQEIATGNTVDSVAAITQLQSIWQEIGPHKHPSAEYYLNTGEGIIRSILKMMERERASYSFDPWSVNLGGYTITVVPDRVVIDSDGTVYVQRARTGRKTKSESDKRIYALLRAAAKAKYPGSAVAVETIYLATGERVNISSKNDAKHLAEYSEAIRNIIAGEFDPKQSSYCPGCEFYFICGA